MGEPDPVARYLARMDEIDGWFGRLDAALIVATCTAQAEAGIRGDLLEIGVFHGKSALLLGHLPVDDERLHVCDPFDALEVADAAPAAERYEPPSRLAFEQRYRAEHGSLPEIHQGPSDALAAELVPRTFRFVHIDGSHRYDDARRDLDLAFELLGPGGVACFDDYRTAITPGVALAVWEAVAAGRMTVIALTGSKCYGVRRGDPFSVPLQAAISHDETFGVECYDLDDDVPALGVWFAGRGPDAGTGQPARRPSGVQGSGTRVRVSRLVHRLPEPVPDWLRAARDRCRALADRARSGS